MSVLSFSSLLHLQYNKDIITVPVFVEISFISTFNYYCNEFSAEIELWKEKKLSDSNKTV